MVKTEMVKMVTWWNGGMVDSSRTVSTHAHGCLLVKMNLLGLQLVKMNLLRLRLTLGCRSFDPT